MSDTFSSDDFDKLLDDFIAQQLQDTEDSLAELNDKSTPQETTGEETYTSEDIENKSEEASMYDIVDSFYDPDAQNLALEEKRLFDAYRGFVLSVTDCGKNAEVSIPEFTLKAKNLLPRFRPSRTEKILNKDIMSGWDVLIAAQPIRLSSLPPNASDEQILAFAEKTTDKHLQLALISYVETLIEIEACEIAYNMRRVKYEKHKIEKKIFEEQQNRRDKMRNYIKAIREKNFPIDAEMLVNNFFKTFRKDPEGAKKMLENNPATFAPIQIDKIPSRFFGMIKAKPEDGKKVNKKLGKFLKNLEA